MTKSFVTLSLLGLTALAGLEAQAISLDFHSINGPTAAKTGSIKFNGANDTFSFVNATAGPGSGFSLMISGIDGGSGDSFDNLGKVDGVFQIGTITTVGTKQTAPVSLFSGAGKLSIKDNNGLYLTGLINWIDISTDQATAGLNSSGTINLTGISYAGTSSDLQALTKDASVTVAFSFLPAKSLKDLTADVYKNGVLQKNVNSTSFSGDIYAVPTPDGGSTCVLLGSGLLGLIRFSRKLRK